MRFIRASSMKMAWMVFSVVCTLSVSAFGQPWDGNGVDGEPYEIWTAADMQAIGADSTYWDAHFVLMADIDLSAYTGMSFNIIGDDDNPFTGVFDGNSHTISNFTYDASDLSYPYDYNIGFFGYVDDPNAKIRDLGLLNPNVNEGMAEGPSGPSKVGSLASVLEDGTISGCYVEGGSVSGNGRVGGLVGINVSGGITDCYSTASVSAIRSDIGGLVGSNGGTISNCSSTGSVSTRHLVGGPVGGLVGHNSGTISNSNSAGSVSGVYDLVGGLVGRNETTINNCYATGSVSGRTDVGGLVGRNNDTITNCYATGYVTGTTEVGGLMGRNYSGTISASFWDIQTSGRSNMCGSQESGGSGCDDGYGKTTAQMQTESTFTDYGWDFFGETDNGTEDIWTILEGINYPEFTWQNPLELGLAIDNVWMYQSLPGQTNSNLIADVLITDDPLSNNSYTYEWEIILPDDVTVAPTITAGGGYSDPCCTFAAPSCNEPNGLSDTGQALTVRVTVTGDDYDNTGTAEAEFGIALLGDANNDGVVNVADRSIINAFWRLGAAGPFTFNDCNVNDDGAVNVADRSIANAVWRGVLGQNRVSNPCPLR